MDSALISYSTFVPPRRPRERQPGSCVTFVLILVLLIVSAPILTPQALAFHDGGTATCEACHVMHSATPGEVLMDGSAPLLTASTASDVCLSCHSDDGVLSSNPLLPGPQRGAGDFVFLLEDNLNDASDGLSNPIEGNAAGHNILSLDHGLNADPRWPTAPGGNFPSSQLGCTSCHDPHGNNNFRLLYGAGEIQGGVAVFTAEAPLAVGLDITDGLQTESLNQHTAYISGMSAWCANCHGYYHDDGSSSTFKHKFSSEFERDIVTNYVRYEGTTSPTSGLAPTAYLPETPFEDPDADINRTQGPGTGSNTMCLTCHRAHASSGPASGRWDFRAIDLTLDGQMSGSFPLPSPYSTGPQNQLCNKCHGYGRRFPEYHSD